MPRLSETLTGTADPMHCQACGQAAMIADGEEGSPLSRWREHDEQDKPENVVVVLCEPCAKRLIEPHPRLYERLHKWHPWPGCMAVCEDCLHREGNRCAHTDAKANGGTGVILTLPKPHHVHVCRSPRRLSGWERLWRGPVSACKQKEAPRASVFPNQTEG